ncbi:DUF4350 domain-containing protein [Arthrobacter sp. zg-Y40]|uniref:DUF4350 domain-containing protein n=1 Tax=Arthrobacter sp. zg-Y40 TaxID=2886939 RepID=UPI001D156F98|nr:DUF4350 domain-containing protein [Arthrobacter sp. zg-Y40]
MTGTRIPSPPVPAGLPGLPTTDTGGSPGGSPAVRAADPGRVLGWFRRHRVLLALVLVLAVVAALSVFARPRQDSEPLSPDNAAPDGAMAVAEVLAGQGVKVQHPQDLAEAYAALDANPGATLLFLDPREFLNSEQREELADEAGRVVLVAPSFAQLSDFAPDIRPAGVVPDDDAGQSAEARCSDEDAQAAGTVSAGGQSYRGPVTCFPSPGAEGTDPAGSYAATRGGSAVVLGSPDLIANATVTDEGNAALALRSLGADETLVWYQAGPQDIAAAEQPADPFDYLPPWVYPLGAWLVLVAGLAAFWRGRRLGPLAEEPLPVVVPAAETVEGRARLYRGSNAVSHAAANLRAAAMTRMAAHLRLGPGADADAVTMAAASATVRSYTAVDHLLNQSMPGTSAELVRWTWDLQDLEEEATSL